jgi:hypothetical protein
MINFSKIKQKHTEAAKNANGRPPAKKQSAGELVLHKGWYMSQPISFSCMIFKIIRWKVSFYECDPFHISSYFLFLHDL